MEALPLAVQTLYAELLEQCRTAGKTYGSLYDREIKGELYTYLKMQVAKSRVDAYLGRTGDDKTRSKRLEIERENASRQQRVQLVQMLRKHLPSHLAPMIDVVAALAWAGIMADAVLVGTNAYACYAGLLGHHLDNAMNSTEDADIATLNLASTADIGGASLETVLQKADASFKGVATPSKSGFPAQFKASNGYRVDILTQMRSSRSSSNIPLPKLKASAMPLQHLAWLIESPAEAVLLSGAGVLVQVPQPARFAVHKLIVAQKRGSTERLKRNKDLAQAKSVILALAASDPEALRQAYEDACAQGRKGWEEPIRKSLREIDVDISK